MKKIRNYFWALLLVLAPVCANATEVDQDVADPLYLEKLGDFTSKSSADFGSYSQLREIATYGFSDRFSVSADVRYKNGADNDTNGFSNIGVQGIYRVGSGNTGVADMIFGFGFGGQGVIPNYSNEVYSIGARTGKQWGGMTLSGTVMTNWFFDAKNGIAYIDLSPEAYFRLKNDWSLGLGATFRKSTTDVFDQEWANTKVGSTIGHTGWFFDLAYEFKAQEFRVGGSINMLF